MLAEQPFLLDRDGRIIAGGPKEWRGKNVSETGGKARKASADELRVRLKSLGKERKASRDAWISVNADQLDSIDASDSRLADALLDRSSYSPQRKKELGAELRRTTNGKQLARLLWNAAKIERADPGKFAREVLSEAGHDFYDASAGFNEDDEIERESLLHAIAELESWKPRTRRQPDSVNKEAPDETVPF